MAKRTAQEDLSLDEDLNEDVSDLGFEDASQSSMVELQEWANTTAVDGLTYKIYRLEPEHYLGKKIAGYLTKVTTLPTEETILSRWGGGKYQLKAYKRDNKGRFSYNRAFTLDVAGDPIVESAGPTLVKPPEDVQLSKLVLEKMERVSEAERHRASRLEEKLQEYNNRGGFDDKTLELIQSQIDQAKEDAREYRRLFEESRNQKPDTKVYEMMIEQARRDTESARRDAENARQEAIRMRDEQRAEVERLRHEQQEAMNSNPTNKLLETVLIGRNAELTQMREQFESERRMLMQNSESEVKRVHERYERILSELKEDHKRTVEFMREDHKREVDLLRGSYESRIQTLELSTTGKENLTAQRVQFLEQELKTSRNDLEKLRAEKQKDPIETLQEIVMLKEAMEDLTGNRSGDEDEKPTWERVLDKISPVAQAVATRLGNPMPGAVTPQEMAMIQAQQQAALQAANTEMAHNEVAAQEQAVQAAQSAEVAKLVAFIEGAIRSGTSPEDFVRSAKSLIPVDVLKIIVDYQADELADMINTAQPGTIIASQEGRNFLRKALSMLKTAEN